MVCAYAIFAIRRSLALRGGGVQQLLDVVLNLAMNKRRLFSRLAALSAAKVLGMPTIDAAAQEARLRTRSRPGDAGWPNEASWEALRAARLVGAS